MMKRQINLATNNGHASRRQKQEDSPAALLGRIALSPPLRVALSVLLLLTTVASATSARPVVWIEAESFLNPGGWSNDSQFVEIMGSPYLLATGVGRPVPDASTPATIPVAGKYRLWVRCKDWLPSHSPGRFQVLVGGRASPTTFGHSKSEAWQWVDGGQFDLGAGPTEVRLHDLSGWWGRCDALVLSGDDFRPADDPRTLAQERERYGGVSREIEDRHGYDVVVTGGGLAGCAAAVAAARHGCHVALLQDRPVLGGNSSSEIQVPPMGDQSHEPWDPMETGLIEEFYPEIGDTSQSRRVERIVAAEPLLDLHLNTRATGVEMKDARTIRSVLALQVRSGRRLRFTAPLFIDCTGHGWIGYWAGAEWRMGEEARSEYNEPDAPLVANAHTMGNDLYTAAFHTHRRPVPFAAPAWAYHWSSADDFETPESQRRLAAGRPANFDAPAHGKGRRPDPQDPNGSTYHHWEIELGGMSDTIRDAETIRDELFRVNIGLWDYAKNYNPQVHEVNRNRELIWLNYVMGVRESRRLLGDYVMTENDYTRRPLLTDAVAYNGWPMDIHHPEGFWVRGSDAMCYYNQKMSIPFRSLYCRNLDNLMMAGRCYSATHLGFGGTRIQRCCCLMGQAVGTAASIIKSRPCTPRIVGREHIAELQQMLLKDGCYLIGVHNCDGADLALKARATASSTAREGENEGLVGGGAAHQLDRDRAVTFPAPQDHVDTVALYLQNDSQRPVGIRVALRAAGTLGDLFASTRDVAAATADVPARSQGWVEFPLQAKLTKGRTYFLLLPADKRLRWHLYPSTVPGCGRGIRWDDGQLQSRAGCYRFRLSPGGEPQRLIQPPPRPENVNQGWNRAVAGIRNAWAPDLKQQKLPQWVQLELPQPAEINTFHVSFQTRKDRGVDFDVEARVDGRWQRLAQVRDNTDRRRVLHFPTVRADRVRLVLGKVAGQMGVCEMRLYRDGDH